MYKKYFLGLFSLLLLGTVFPTNVAQSQKDLDQRCFTQEECRAARATMGVPVERQAEGFYNNNPETRTACRDTKDPSGVELGFCLPAGETTSAVKFGGVSKFANIGVFIQYIYRYGVVFAGILAVIVIIVAGLQWTASGGNSSTIESAKKRIVGAITGLILASTSYVILNTVSPSTLNLRLPQIWMIRPSPISNPYKYCMAMPAAKASDNSGWVAPKIAPFQENYRGIPAGNFQDAFTAKGDLNAFLPAEKIQGPVAKCGEKMYVQGTEGDSCTGTYCPQGSFCFDEQKFCLPLPVGSGIVGEIKATPASKYVDQIWLKVACGSEGGKWTVEDIDSIDLGEAKNFYFFLNPETEAIDECGSKENIKGYFFIVEVNDSDTAQTDDDQWIGGRSFCTQVTGNSCGFYGASQINSGDAEQWIEALSNIGELFTVEEVGKGFQCGLKISTETMPNLGNGVIVQALSDAGNLLGKTPGQIIDAATGSTPDELQGKINCPHLKDLDAKYSKFMRENRN
jgi:hypothetical protein